MFGLQAQLSMIFDWKFGRILMSQPFKNIVNIVVFMRFRFSDLSLILTLARIPVDPIRFSTTGLARPGYVSGPVSFATRAPQARIKCFAPMLLALGLF